MKVYRKDETDIVFSQWEDDLAQLDTLDAIVIPRGATNGDMIKAMFPNIEFTDMAFTVHAEAKVTSNGVKGGISYDFWKYWWNAPYRGSQS